MLSACCHLPGLAVAWLGLPLLSGPDKIYSATQHSKFIRIPLGQDQSQGHKPQQERQQDLRTAEAMSLLHRPQHPVLTPLPMPLVPRRAQRRLSM